MNHTPEIKKAIQFAARKHAGQLRAESEPLPYITHLFSTALLVAEDGEDDAVVIAALLHDVLEDTETNEEELARAFGSRVCEIVKSVTEPKKLDGRVLEWKERKKMYLAQLELGTDDALIVAMADKIDNIESTLEGVAREGSDFLKKWSRPQREYLWFYEAVLNIGIRRLAKHRLVKRLAEACERERALID